MYFNIVFQLFLLTLRSCESKPHASIFFGWCRFSESIDDLRLMYEKLERKIAKKRKLYQGYREKLMVESLADLFMLKLVCVVVAA